jgi:hypothetical protein
MSGNSDLARAALGSLILRPAIIEGSGVSAEDFPSGRLRETFRGIAEQWENSRAEKIDERLLAYNIGGDGPFEFVSSLTIGFSKMDLEPETFSRRLFELRRQSLRRLALAEVAQSLHCEEKTGEFDQEGFKRIRAILQRFDKLETDQGAFDPSDVLKRAEDLQTLDSGVKWIVSSLLPAQSITLFHAPGGTGKTWIALLLSYSIAEGLDFFSLATLTRPVIYIDFENPLSVIVERVRKLEIRNVLFWHQAFNPKPPKLDSDDYTLYKRLPPGSLIIFDTLRAAHDRDENDSKEMACIMSRLKEIRDAGFSILLIHHTPRANQRASKGSTAITDLADNVLSLYRVRSRTYQQIKDDDEPGPDDLFRFGTGEKTRFEPAQIFFRRGEGGIFELAEDPDREFLAALSKHIRGSKIPQTQSDITAWARTELEIFRKGRIVSLLCKGDGRLWRSRLDGRKRLYEPI